MIPDVVGFGAELEAKLLVDGECLEQTHVPVLKSRLIDKVANALGVEGARRRRCEDRCSIRIRRGEPLAVRPERADDFWIAIHDPELAIAAAAPVSVLSDARVVHIRRDNAAGQAGLKLCDAAELPSAKGLPASAFLLAKERQLVNVVDRDGMADIEFGRSPKHARVVRIGNDVTLVRAIIHAF